MAVNFEIDTSNTALPELIERFFKTFPQYSEDQSEEKFIRSSYEILLSVKNDEETVHSFRVAAILANSNFDYITVASGLLHNILSYSSISSEEIEKKFGKDLFTIISGLQRYSAVKTKNKTLHEADSIRKMLFALSDDIRTIFVKLADRLDRIRYITSFTKEKQKSLAQEAIDIWAPLAGRLGMSALKNEFEDLSLKVTNPDVFAQLKKIVDMKKNERESYLEKTQKEIYKAAEKANINVQVTARAKHFYSIYQKMRRRNKAADELYDLLAVRILCDSVSECYTCIGIIHGLWKPVEGRFKDYIAMPKSNGYQSLHTTVVCEGKPLEIQIRTKEMHRIAEHGIASHWLYKKGMNHDSVSIENLSIVNQLKDLKNSDASEQDSFKAVKAELLGDSIFVFTPKGEVKELPQGSTAIDFAYAIHSTIGQTITGAKANGSIIPLSYHLKNTQIIEILTSPNAHPTQNQLLNARTSKARQKIRSWLASNSESISESEVPKETEKEKHERERHKTKEEHEKELSQNSAVSQSQSLKIRIGDTTNFLISIAKCCMPKYGDKITGYVSRGRGIIIHKADCRNFFRIPNISERTLDVEWEEPKEKTESKTKKKK